MGWVAIGYGSGAAFALAIACCGPSPLAKVFAAYLFASWLTSNKVFGSDLVAVMEAFTYIDFIGAAAAFVALSFWPARWLTVLFAAALVQMLLHLAYVAGPQTHGHAYVNILLNNLLFVVQLVAVVIPAAAQGWARRRAAPPASRKSTRSPRSRPQGLQPLRSE